MVGLSQLLRCLLFCYSALCAGVNSLLVQSTFTGRLKHFLEVVDPTTLFTTKVSVNGVNVFRKDTLLASTRDCILQAHTQKYKTAIYCA